MSQETGAVYTIETISNSTGLSLKYLKNKDSSLNKFIGAYPQFSPDKRGLNYDGLELFKDYLERCSSLDSDGNRRVPEMTFDQFKEYAMEEFGVNSSDTEAEVSSTELATVKPSEIVDVEVMPISNPFDGIDGNLEALGEMLASRVGQSIRAKVTNKVAEEINARFAEIDDMINQFTK